MPKKVFPGRFDSLDRIREFVKNVARRAGLGKDSVYSVMLAVDEACSNIIEHGYAGAGGGKIECDCEETEQGIVVVLRDWGIRFDPDDVPEVDPTLPLSEVNPRGAGLYLMRQLMDEVRFEYSEKDGNILTMVKHRKQ